MHQRDNNWLEQRLSSIWQTYFADIEQANPVRIRFGQQASNRLGSIRYRHGTSVITITGFFRDERVPDFVVDETIAHELVHYTHGFESPRPQLYRYPHEGGIVHRELVKRGLAKTHRDARRWLKQSWSTIRGPVRRRHVIRHRRPKLILGLFR